MLQVEFPFTLPCGYIDDAGGLHRGGTMRRATALDEVEPLRDARVRANPAYASILVLSRVVTRLGTLDNVRPTVIERLFAADFVYLQELYASVNGEAELLETECPTCGTRFALDPHDAHD